MTSQGTSDQGAGRSLLGTVRAARSVPTRTEALEQELDQLRRRVADLEASLAAVDAVRDEVRSLTETVTEELNRAQRAT